MIESLLILLSVLLLINYLFFLSGVLRGLNSLPAHPANKIPDEFISVIIPFRNESRNILSSLECLQYQSLNEEKFEVIYVDDESTDDSFDKLKNAISKKNVAVLKVPSGFHQNAHKKRAVAFGIENSKGGIIVTTDADCRQSSDWLITLLSFMDDETGFVSGPVKFSEDGGIFGKLQAIEFSGLILTGAGLIGINKPVICNAANIAYRRKAFEKVNGFSDNLNLSSGDDEFLMQKINSSTEYKVKFCSSNKAVVETDPSPTIKDFILQRRRWASKGLFYANLGLKLNLILIFLFYIFLAAQFIAALFINPAYWKLLIISIISKAGAEYSILAKGKGKFVPKGFGLYFPVAEILQIPYIILASVLGTLGNFTWKDRKVKR